MQSEKSLDQHQPPLLIGLSGGPAAGKERVCQLIMESLIQRHSLASEKVVMIRMEDFFIPVTDATSVNQHLPERVDFDLLLETIQGLHQGHEVKVPAYDMESMQRCSQKTLIKVPDVVLLPGIHMLHHPTIRDKLDLKVFIDVDSDTRLSKLVLQELEKPSARPLTDLLEIYVNEIKPAFEDFILPTKRHADVIIPRGEDNRVAIDLLTEHIMDRLCQGRDGQVFQSSMPLKSNLYTRSLSALNEPPEYQPVAI